jgi:hypothetical protein
MCRSWRRHRRHFQCHLRRPWPPLTRRPSPRACPSTVFPSRTCCRRSLRGSRAPPPPPWSPYTRRRRHGRCFHHCPGRPLLRRGDPGCPASSTRVSTGPSFRPTWAPPQALLQHPPGRRCGRRVPGKLFHASINWSSLLTTASTIRRTSSTIASSSSADSKPLRRITCG